MTEVSVSEIKEVLEDTTGDKEFSPGILNPKAWLEAGGLILPVDTVNLYVDQNAALHYSKAVETQKEIQDQIDALDTAEQWSVSTGPRGMTEEAPLTKAQIKRSELEAELEKVTEEIVKQTMILRETKMVATLKGLGAKWVDVQQEARDRRLKTAEREIKKTHFAAIAAAGAQSPEAREVHAAELKEKLEKASEDAEEELLYIYTAHALKRLEVTKPQQLVLDPVSYSTEEAKDFAQTLPASERQKLASAVYRIMYAAQMIDPSVDAGFPG